MSNVATIKSDDYQEQHKIRTHSDFLRLHANLIRFGIEKGDWSLVNYSIALLKQKADEMELSL
jgi:hypothetical protein